MDTTSPKESDNSADKPAAPMHKGMPKGIWGAILTTTPIVLTTLATVFAGMSSSEMTQSMYFRSLAAQHQSKAGDQWAFFQAKRIRSTSLEMTVELIQSLARPDAFDPSQVDVVSSQMLHLLKNAVDAERGDVAAKLDQTRQKLVMLIADEKTRQSLPYLTGAALPKVEVRSLRRKEVQEAIDAVIKATGEGQTEGSTAGVIARLNPGDIEETARLITQDADSFEKACVPVEDTINRFRDALGELAAEVRPFRRSAAHRAEDASPLEQVPALLDRLNNSFKAAAMDFEARQYRQESIFNRKAAEIYEIQIRRSGVESDRRRERSKKFFYSMLIAQLGGTVSWLALARAQRSILWVFALLAGIAALGFGGYVYLLL